MKSLESENYTVFYHQILVAPGAPGVVTALCVDNQIIAVLYGLIYKQSYSMLLSSFKAGEWQYSPVFW